MRKIFIFEPDQQALERATLAVGQGGFAVVAARTAEEATVELEAGGFCGLLVADGPAGIEIGQYIKEFTEITAPLAAVVAQSAADPRSTVEQMGADVFLRRPLTSNAIELFVDLGGRLMAQYGGHSGEYPRQASGVFELPRTSNLFHTFEEAKDFLLLEVRRAKRYAYPLAVLLVRLDPIPALQQIQRPSLPREITGGLAVAIAKSVRVIDLPVHYADDSIMVFLPHTELSGAVEVGRRIKRRIKRITYRDTDLTCEVTASVGVAGLAVGDRVTFSRLIKDATAAVRAAQLKGGDRVMKRSTVSISPLKAAVEQTGSTKAPASATRAGERTAPPPLPENEGTERAEVAPEPPAKD